MLILEATETEKGLLLFKAYDRFHAELKASKERERLMKLREEKLKNLIKWKQTRIMGGLHHITEAYDSYLETELNESEKFGFKRTLHIRQNKKKVSDSLVVNEIWEHETDEENDQKTISRSPEKSIKSKKIRSIDLNLVDLGNYVADKEIVNSVSSGETLMQVAPQTYHLSLIGPKKTYN